MQKHLSELPALTGLRGFAALWVLLFHVWALAGSPLLRVGESAWTGIDGFLSLGWAGVDLFFCLSAFLLTLPYAQWRSGLAPRPDTGRYLWKRVLRIYPAYLTQLAILLLIAVVITHDRTLSLGEFIAHLFLWFNVGRDWVAPLVGVWFTLPIEFGFYLILPFLAPLLDRRRWPWLLVAAIAVAIGWRMLALANSLSAPIPVRVIEIERLPGRIDQFVIGMLAGSAYIAARVRGWRPSHTAFWFWGGTIGFVLLGVALALIANVYWDGHPLLYIWHALASACLVPILLAAAWDAKPSRWLFDNRPLRYLGATSFGVYLWHMPILLWILPHLPASLSAVGRFWLLLALVLPATLIVAHLSYWLIERPALRLGHRRSAHPGLETELPERAAAADGSS
ncbi:MAG: acyltransferase [Dokdonella sp.]